MSLRAFDLLHVLSADVAPQRTKIHLATWNGIDHPLDLFRAGSFEGWQATQNRRNFERDFVVALISMPERHRWLFGGAYRSRGGRSIEGPSGTQILYDLEEINECDELKGRLVTHFERPGRQSYLNAEGWSGEIMVAGLMPERITIQEFPGYKAVHLTKPELDAIVDRRVESWHAALSSVGGVYLISDEASGRLYVGSASGDGGFWQRWTSYCENGHGGNVELRDLLCGLGAERAASLRFSILEIADLATGSDVILARESHWKRVLLTRVHGLNAN